MKQKRSEYVCMYVCMCVHIVKFILITDQIKHRQSPVKKRFLGVTEGRAGGR